MIPERAWLASKIFFLLILGLITAFGLLFTSTLQAQDQGWAGVLPGETLATNPKERDTTISAIVPVWEAPPVPILISPKNNSYTSSRRVTFKWELPDHIAAYKHLDLSVDGERLFAKLPPYSKTTDEYELTVEDGEYTLRLTSDSPLDDGLHTWKVRSVDIHDNGTDSTTWSFTIDSVSPLILLTQIDTQEIAISSADSQTIPTQPIEVTTWSPKLTGKTEADIVVQLTVIQLDGSETLLETTSDSEGWFSFTLPELKANQVVSLRFSTADKAGNATVLDGVKVMYVPRKVVVEVLPPGVFPDPLVIELPEFPPRITWPKIALPPIITDIVEPVVEPVVEPTASFVDLLVSFIQDYTWFGVGLVLLFWWLYLVLLYWLTGGAWRYFGRFAGQWVQAWFKGWTVKVRENDSKQTDKTATTNPSPNATKHLWREDQYQQLLPVLIFILEIYNQETKQVEQEVRFTSLLGEWTYQPEAGRLYSLQLANRRWVYPSWEIAISEERDGTERRLMVAGENWYQAETQDQLTTSTEAFVLEAGKRYQLVAWARRAALPLSSWLLYTPRLSLLVSFGLAMLMLINLTTWWSIGLFLWILWVLLRDVQWQVPKAWKVYVA